jgi:oligopeptide transport system substrate-binding protein
MRTLLLLALVLPLAAGGVARADPEERPKGKLRIALAGKIETLDPPKAASEQARICVTNLFDQLYEYEHLARPYRLKPCLAAAMPEISEDGLVQTIRLRKGIRYRDDPCFPGGKARELVAADVVFCLKRLMDAHVKSPGRWMLEQKIVGLDAFAAASADKPEDPHRHAYGPVAGYPAVAGLLATGPHTLQVKLLKPMPELVWLLAGTWMSVYPPEAVKQYGARFGEHPVSTGPYDVTLFVGQRTLLLQRDPGYREDRYPTEGMPGDERDGYLADAGRLLPLHAYVEVKSYETAQAAWLAFQSGQADYAEIPRDSFAAVVVPATGEPHEWVKERGVRLHRDPRLEIQYDAFNMEDPVLGQPAGEKGLAIRRAISVAADDVYAMTRLYTHVSERVYGPLLPEFDGYDHEFRNDWLPRDGESRKDLVAAAADILAEAGLEGGKGVPALKMHIMNDPSSAVVFGVLKKHLAEIGLTVEPVPVDWPTMQAALKEGKAQMWSSSWYADYPSAQNFLQLFYGPNAPDPNFTRYSNPEFDEYYEEAYGLPAGQERTDAYRMMQRIAANDCPWRYRFRRIRWAASHQWLSGYRHNDIVPKYFKYCRPDDAARQKAVESWK